MASSHQELWLEMAVEARIAAERLYDRELRLQMLVVAAGYEAMAKRIETLAKVHTPANTNDLTALPTPANQIRRS